MLSGVQRDCKAGNLSQNELDEIMSKTLINDTWEAEWDMLDNLVLSIEILTQIERCT